MTTKSLRSTRPITSEIWADGTMDCLPCMKPPHILHEGDTFVGITCPTCGACTPLVTYPPDAKTIWNRMQASYADTVIPHSVLQAVTDHDGTTFSLADKLLAEAMREMDHGLRVKLARGDLRHVVDEWHNKLRVSKPLLMNGLPTVPMDGKTATQLDFERMRAAGFGLLRDPTGTWMFFDLKHSEQWAEEHIEDSGDAAQIVVVAEHTGLPCATMELAIQDAIEWLDGKRFQNRTAANTPGDML